MARTKPRRFRHAVAVLALLGAAGTSPRPIGLPGARLFPESVSILGGYAYTGSMSGGVMRTSLATGRSERWLAPGSYGSGALFGVLADARNRMLWTCTNAFAGTGIAIPGAAPGSWLKGFDLASGAGRVSLPLPGARPTCNDMAVAKDGSLLVTDTGAPEVLRWRPGAAALEVWARDPVLGEGLDSIALADDGNVYVNNWLSGALYRIEVRANGGAGPIARLATSRPLVAPDAMRPVGGLALALVEGGDPPRGGRIDRVTITGDAAEVRTLADSIDEPTGLDVHGGAAWYVQGYLSYLFDPAKAERAPPSSFRLTPVPLAR